MKAISVSFPLKYGANGGTKFPAKCAAQELVKCIRDTFTDIIENPSVEVVRIFKSAGTKNEDWRYLQNIMSDTFTKDGRWQG